MTSFGGRLASDLDEAPAVLRRQAEALRLPLAELVVRLMRQPPELVMTCARGSSAHAATFAKHLVERHLGLPVAAAAPNIASVYRRGVRLRHQFFLAISQSGGSDDLVETAAMARAQGALTVALVNEPDSALASACEFLLPMAAGPELSVAATKTFIASLSALLRMTAAWAGHDAMASACDRLPDRLQKAAGLDWSDALPALEDASSLVAIGRGPTLAVAREAALKLKETCALHAEAFSSAEFRHGPIALVEATYPIMVFVPTDECANGVAELVVDLTRKGACVLAATPGSRPPLALPVVAPEQPEADAICLVRTFYGILVRLAERRGADIDSPRHLQKVTRTR